ncbi:MAG: hypothetical protein AB1664_11770, partial [Thermodesulfobacteriota bacterium]
MIGERSGFADMSRSPRPRGARSPHPHGRASNEDLKQKARSGRMARLEEMWQCQTVNCGYIYNP